MNLPKLAVAALFLTVAVGRAAITSTNIDAGSAVIDIGPTKLHEGSSLRYQWIILNDDACPVQLHATNAISQDLEGHYFSKLQGSATPSQDIQAYSVTYILFDPFNQETVSRHPSLISDCVAGRDYALPWAFDKLEGFTCVLYINAVRKTAGPVWTADQTAIDAELSKLHLKRK